MATFDRVLDARIRNAAFNWLASQSAVHGEVLPRTLLAAGFSFEGSRIRLVGPQGIFKPAAMDVPLSIATVPSGPYGDALGFFPASTWLCGPSSWSEMLRSC